MTHTPSEWAAMFCIATSGYASFSVFYFLFVDADPCDFDPRPLARRAVAAVDRARPVVWDVTRSDALYPLLREWDNARHACRELRRDIAALLVLLTTRPKGALR